MLGWYGMVHQTARVDCNLTFSYLHHYVQINFEFLFSKYS